VLQFVCECDVVKDTGKEEYLRPFIHIGLDWISFWNWAYVRQDVYFWAYGTPGYRFSAFSYDKPSDFRRNFRPTRIEVTKIFVGL